METTFCLELIGRFKQTLSPDYLSGQQSVPMQIMSAFALAEKIIKQCYPPAVETLLEEKAEWQAAIDLLADYVLDWEDLIATLPKQYSRILILFSLENKSWSQVAKLTAQSEDTCRALFQSAADYIDKLRPADNIKQKYENLLNGIKKQQDERESNIQTAISKKEGVLR